MNTRAPGASMSAALREALIALLAVQGMDDWSNSKLQRMAIEDGFAAAVLKARLALALPAEPALTIDEQAAVEFYAVNPRAAVFDLRRRLNAEPAQEAAAPAEQRELQLSGACDRFEYSASVGDMDSIAIHDDDFTYDATLRISGDFPDFDTKLAYAKEIVGLLATPTQANEWSADRALGFEEGKAEGRRLAQWREPTPRAAAAEPVTEDYCGVQQERSERETDAGTKYSVCKWKCPTCARDCSVLYLDDEWCHGDSLCISYVDSVESIKCGNCWLDDDSTPTNTQSTASEASGEVAK